MLDRKGLSDEEIAERHAENLGATKVVGWRDGRAGEKEPIGSDESASPPNSPKPPSEHFLDR